MGIWNSTLVYVGARTLLAAAMVALLLRRRVGVWHTGGQIVSDLSCAAFLLAYVNPDIREDVGVLVIPLLLFVAYWEASRFAERPRTRGGAVRRQNGRAGSGVHISICPEPHDANGHPHGSSVPGAAGRARFRRHRRLRGKCEFRGGAIRFTRVSGAVFLLGDIPVMSILLTMLAPLCLLRS